MRTPLQMWLKAAVAVVAVVLMGACANDAAPYETADDLAAALARANVECAAPQAGLPATLVRSQASCVSGASRLGLYVFDSAQERDNWLRVGAQLGPVAVGPNWAVNGDDDIVERAAAALHGRFHELK